MRLKEIRKQFGKTQDDIAKVIGMNRASYSNIESGKRETDYQTLLTLADYFGVSVDYILGREQERPAHLEGDGLTDDQRRLLDLFDALNAEGREKLLDYADDLVSSGKYIKTDKAKMA